MKRNKKMLSEKDIKDYFNSQTSTERKLFIEEKAQQDSFFAEALKGYKMYPEEIANINSIKNNFKKKHFGTKVHYAWYLAVPVIVTAACYLLFINIKPEVLTKPALHNISPLEEGVSPSELMEEVELEEQMPKREEDEAKAEIKQEILSEPIINEKTTTGKVISINPIKDIIPPSTVAMEASENKKIRKTKAYNFPVNYFNNLKVADYSKTDLKKIDITEVLTSNTEAKYNDKAAKSKKAERAQRNEKQRVIADLKEAEQEAAPQFSYFVGYNDYLKESIEYFKKEDYETALEKFGIIQQTYADDVNALFYTGLCHYELRNPEKAIKFLNKVEDLHINVFHEEAEWYKALSFEMKGEMEKAKVLFQKILENEGFYSEKASLKLEK